MSSEMYKCTENTKKQKSIIRKRIFIICLVTFCQLIWLYYVVHFFLQNHYLPEPFVYDKYDSFMDFFHPLFWSVDPGRYSEWRSVYPPLVFAILEKIDKLYLGGVRVYDAFYLRTVSLSIIVAYIMAAFSGIIGVFFSGFYRCFTTYEKIIGLIFYSLSSPLLFTIERGNLIILCLPLLLLLFAGSKFVRIVSLAALINIKPYFVMFMFSFLIVSDYRSFAQCFIVSGLIFLLTGVVMDQNFPIFFQSLLGFSSGDLIFDPNAVLSMDASISAFAYAEKWAQWHGLESFVNYSLSRLIMNSALWINIFLLAILIYNLIKSRRYLYYKEILAIMTVLMTNASFSFGGYTLILYVCSFPVFYKMRNGTLLALIIIGLFLPLDFFIMKEGLFSFRQIFMTGLYESIPENLGWGAFLRPILNISLVVIIILELTQRQNYNPANKIYLCNC